MDPLVAARSPSSRSGDDESPGCSVEVNYMDDSDSIIFEGEVNESMDICNGTMPRTIRQKSNIRDNRHDDDDDESESESDSTLHDCRWNGCDRRFTRLKKMVTHVNDDHVRMEDVDYTCKWEGCTRQGKSFNARYKMLIHMRTHTNEKPHHCSTCLKRFSRLENLKIHTRSHTGEKPYVCPVKGCNKAYSNSSDRFKHTRTHFDDKPFVCKKEGCGKRYTDPSSLRKHMKIFGHREPIANNNLTINRTKERAILVVDDDTDDDDDVGSGVLFHSDGDYGALTMHADMVSLTKTGKPMLRKQLHRPLMAVKKTKRSAKDTLVKIPGSGPLDLTITLD